MSVLKKKKKPTNNTKEILGKFHNGPIGIIFDISELRDGHIGSHLLSSSAMHAFMIKAALVLGNAVPFPP